MLFFIVKLKVEVHFIILLFEIQTAHSFIHSLIYFAFLFFFLFQNLIWNFSTLNMNQKLKRLNKMNLIIKLNHY